MKQVSIRACESYDYDVFRKSFEKMIEDIGGLGKFVKEGSKVVIKPNLVIKKHPEEGATTHPVLVRIVCEELLKLNCEVIIAESPGGPYNKSNLKGFYKTCGLIDELSDLDIKFNYDTSEVQVHNDDAVYLKTMEVIKPIDDVINLCKLKTHKMAKYTGGVKNLYGVIPGLKKAEIHYRFQKEELFCENVLLDICDYVKPSLTIMDGVYAMEGEGPTAGDVRKVGVLIASESPHALDIAGCKLINLDPMKVGTVRGSIKRNLIKDDFDEITVKAFFHESSGYVSRVGAESSTTRSKPMPSLLCTIDEGNKLIRNDVLSFSGKEYIVSEIKDVNELGIFYDVSLEEVQNG